MADDIQIAPLPERFTLVADITQEDIDASYRSGDPRVSTNKPLPRASSCAGALALLRAYRAMFPGRTEWVLIGALTASVENNEKVFAETVMSNDFKRWVNAHDNSTGRKDNEREQFPLSKPARFEVEFHRFDTH
jgi:hypothetical protein